MGDGRTNARGERVELFHARLVAEDRTTATGTRRIDREHRDAIPLLDQRETQRLDERRLSRTRRSRDPDPDRVAGVRHYLGEQLLGVFAVIAPCRLDERDRPRQRASIPVDHLPSERIHPASLPATTRLLLE